MNKNIELIYLSFMSVVEAINMQCCTKEYFFKV